MPHRIPRHMVSHATLVHTAQHGTPACDGGPSLSCDMAFALWRHLQEVERTHRIGSSAYRAFMSSRTCARALARVRHHPSGRGYCTPRYGCERGWSTPQPCPQPHWCQRLLLPPASSACAARQKHVAWRCEHECMTERAIERERRSLTGRDTCIYVVQPLLLRSV